MRSPHIPLAVSVLESSKSVTIAHGLGLSHALTAHRRYQLISLPPPPSLIHPSIHPSHPFQPTTTKPPSSPPNPPSSSSTTRTTSPNPSHRGICLSKLPYLPQLVVLQEQQPRASSTFSNEAERWEFFGVGDRDLGDWVRKNTG